MKTPQRNGDEFQSEAYTGYDIGVYMLLLECGTVRKDGERVS